MATGPSGDSRRCKSAQGELEGQKHDVKEGVGDLLLFLVGFVRGQSDELLLFLGFLLSLAGRHCGVWWVWWVWWRGKGKSGRGERESE